MEIVNQITGALAQSNAVTRQQSADKSTQIRRAQLLRKDVAARGDSFEHQVESTEELSPIHDDQSSKNGKGKRQKRSNSRATNSGDDDNSPPPPPSLDLTA
jgi:hypothetical protein